ncbi:NAD(P)-binding protein [Pyrenochaeta sp. DS3sAY3a]|nr:NAD(P)-binding protein [Pyrenochaeta sp. DS3sAY3a]
MASKVLDFEGDVAIVTGAGCRSSNEVGNGRAVAILLARRGAKVALVDVNIKWAEETKQFIVSEGGLAHAIEADVSDEQSCQRIVNETVKVFGGLNLLVNNVGVTGALGDSTTIDLDDWDRTFRVNVKSMIMMARYAIPEMKKSTRSAIVNMSSISGFYVEGGALLYPTTKASVIQLTKAMAAQHGPDGIRVNCVCPGAVYTPMVQGAWMTESVRQSRIDKTMLKIEGYGWDIGYATLFLLSKEARWITAQVMTVDGGVSRSRSCYAPID